MGDSAQPASQVEGAEFVPPSQTKVKRKPSVKGKKPTINVSSIVLPSSALSDVSVEPSAASAKAVKKSNKKINVDVSKLSLLKEKKNSDEEARLTDIAEEE